MNLAAMQHDFQSWLTAASHDAAARLGGAAGLAIYQNNYRAQLIGCLEQAFPQLRGWIGADAFQEAAIAHIQRTPPHAWTLDAYGDGFGATLGALFPDNPDLHELAWIEHALAAAFVAADAAPLALDGLAGIDWDTARLRLAPSLQAVAATTNAERIWSALWERSTVPQGEMLDTPGGLVVWRRGFRSSLRAVDALELHALLQLRRDGSFAALCALLVGQLGESAGVAKAGALLADWIAHELITGVDAA
jgi:hypothetical protein